MFISSLCALVNTSVNSVFKNDLNTESTERKHTEFTEKIGILHCLLSSRKKGLAVSRFRTDGNGLRMNRGRAVETAGSLKRIRVERLSGTAAQTTSVTCFPFDKRAAYVFMRAAEDPRDQAEFSAENPCVDALTLPDFSVSDQLKTVQQCRSHREPSRPRYLRLIL